MLYNYIMISMVITIEMGIFLIGPKGSEGIELSFPYLYIHYRSYTQKHTHAGSRAEIHFMS